MNLVRAESRGSTLKARAPRWLLDGADASTRALALATVGDRPGPDFLVVGTKRGGTTSLYNYLMQHPGILGTFPRLRSKKSTNFFFADRPRSNLWYRSHFHTQTFRRVLESRLGYRPLGFEASPYYIWDPRIAPRVHDLYPHLKAVVLLRDPVRRAWSHYQERVQNGVEPLTFDQALNVENARLMGEVERMSADPHYHSTAYDWYSYRRRGEYLSQIQNWHVHFPMDQLLILRSEDLYARPQQVVDDVCTFLGIPRHPLPDARAFNATWRTRSSIPAAQESLLREHYSGHNRDLEDYLRTGFGWL